MILAETTDVEVRLGRVLTDDELERVDGLLEEASALVEGYLGVTYTLPEDVTEDPIPSAVRLVVSKMVARAIVGDTTIAAAAAMAESMSAGPFNARFRDSNVWLSKSDKLMLRAVGAGVSSVRFVSERGYR